MLFAPVADLCCRLFVMLACTWLPKMFSRCAGLYWKNSIYALRLRPAWTISSQTYVFLQMGYCDCGDGDLSHFFGTVVGLGQSSSNNATVMLRHREFTGARWLQLLHTGMRLHHERWTLNWTWVYLDTRACMSIYEHEYAEPHTIERGVSKGGVWWLKHAQAYWWPQHAMTDD